MRTPGDATNRGRGRTPLVAALLLLALAIVVLVLARGPDPFETGPAHDAFHPGETEAPALRGAPRTAEPVPATFLTGRVVTAYSRGPVAGARVGYVAATTTTPRPPRSVIRYRGPTAPRAAVEVGPELETRVVLREDALARAVATDEAGRFRLPYVEGETRIGVVDDAHLPAQTESRGPGLEHTFVLSPGWRVVGRVVPPSGGILPSGYRFGLVGLTAPFVTWIVPCAADGSFAAVVEGDHCVPFSLDPLAQFGANVPAIRPESGDVVLRLEAAACVTVVDNETGAPIETFRVLVEDTAGRVIRASVVEHPEGRFRVLDEIDGWPRLDVVARVLVWAEGHAAWTAPGAAFRREPRQVARLRPGGADAVLGAVRRRGDPVPGAVVTLRAVDATWNPGRPVSSWREVVAVRTDDAGRFELRAPDGEYVVVARHGDAVRFRKVAIPTREILGFELGGTTLLRVAVAGLRPGEELPPTIVLRDEHGTVRRRRSTACGRAWLRDVAPGTYVITALSDFEAYVPARRLPGAWTRLEVGEGPIQDVRLGPPRVRSALPEGRRLLAVRLADVEDPSGWEARDKYDHDLGWQPLAVDATVLLKRVLEIRAPDGRRWTICPLAGQFEQGVVELRTVGASLRGVLVDEATGSPLAGYVVRGREIGAKPTVLVDVTTDRAGAFRIDGLAKAPHVLRFQHPPGEAIRGIRFYPEQSPAAAPAPLRIALPRVRDGGLSGYDTTTLTATVTKRGTAVSGDPRGGGLEVEARLLRPGGTLGLAPRGSAGPIGGDGRVPLTVVVAEAYVVTVWPTSGRGEKPVVLRVEGPEALREISLD